MGVYSARYDDSYTVGEGRADDVARSRAEMRYRSQQPKAGDTSEGGSSVVEG